MTDRAEGMISRNIARLGTGDPIRDLAFLGIARSRRVSALDMVNSMVQDRIAEGPGVDEAMLPSELHLSEAEKKQFGRVLSRCESVAEQLFLISMIRVARLAEHETTLFGDLEVRIQVEIDNYRVDFLVDDDLVVEIDGQRYHDNSEAFQSDRMRDQRLLAKGYRVVRFPAKQVLLNADEVAATVKRIAVARPRGRE
jgi:very-short-patch-repair endonuclease